MKRGFFIQLALLGLAVLGAWLSGAHRQAPPAAAAFLAPVAPVAAEVARTPMHNPDSINIFQRTFWRSPSAADHIVNAMRREWTGEDGIPRWQSFLVVKASPELLRELRDANAFRLVAADAVTPIPEAPAWFAFEPSEVSSLRARTGRLQLFFSKSSPLLYAAASGGGFRPGAPEAPTPPVTVSRVSAGRLPTTLPPLPSPL